MSSHSSTPGPSQPPDPPPPLINRAVDTAAPVAGILKEIASGVPVPGLAAAFGGVAVILETLRTMQNNKEDLQELRKGLVKLRIDIDNAGIGESTNKQVRRVAETSKKLERIILTCDKLARSRKIIRFIQAKSIATQIADVRQSVRDTLQVFQVFSIISIENNVTLVKDAVVEMGDDVVEIGDNVVAIGDNVAVIDTNVVEIGGKVAAISKSAEDANRFAILNRLERAPARFDARDTPLECMGGTRVKLLDKLIGCMKGMAGSFSTPSPPRFTLVCGIPGSGKSTIAKTVAVRLKDQGLLAASFFFSRNHATRREISLVFSTIAFQLAHYNDEYRKILSETLQDIDLVDAKPIDHLEKFIIHPLSQLIPKTREPWVILLDALDECGSDHGETLLELLLSRVGKFPDHVRFFFTGRPEDPIRSAFETASIKTLTYIHTLDTSLEAPVTDDIRHYLKQSLSNEWRGWDGWKVKDDDLNVLVMRAGGLFIFASTAVEYIRDCAATDGPQTATDSIIHDVDQSNPHLLDQLYLKIIDGAVPVNKPAFVARYRQVLGAVIHLQEPLNVAEIASLLGMEFGDVSRVIRRLKSVLLVSEETVRIAHLSFNEYITGRIREYRKDLVLDSPTHHSDLANGSINLMNKRLHQNMCGLNPPDMYAGNADIPNLAALITEKIPPSLRYACMYWASHFSGADNMDPKGLEEWLDTRILFWLEVLSMCNELPRAAPLIFDARIEYNKIVTATPTDSARRYLTLLSDTSRFIGAFYDNISHTASHIYYSALPFIPSSSELSRTYNHVIRVIKGANLSWSPLLYTINTGGYVWDVTFSPNGKCIAAACGNNIGIWSSESGHHILTLEGHTGYVNAIAFSPDGARVASGSDDETIRIWSLEDGHLLSTLKGHTEGVYAIAFSPDGARIASGSYDKTIRIWSSDGDRFLCAPEEGDDYVNPIAFSPDGACIASGSWGGIIRIWSSEDGQPLCTLEGHTGSVRVIVFSPDGTRIASGSVDKTVRIWSSDGDQLLSISKGHSDYVNAIAFSPDGACIASGSRDKTIRLWSLEDGQLLSTLEGHASFINSVKFSPDGAHIASGSSDKTVRIWSLNNGQLLSAPEGHTKFVKAIAFSPDGAHIASGSSDETIRIWSSSDGRLLSTLKGHTWGVNVVTFSPDGARIASGSNDRTIRLWSLHNGQLLSTLIGHTSSVYSIAFSSDGAHIVSSSWQKEDTVRVWSSKTGELISTHDQTHSVEDVVRSLDEKQQDSFPPSGSSPTTSDLSKSGPSGFQSSPSVQVDQKGGRLTLPSGELLCDAHLPPGPFLNSITTSAQHGSLLVLGLYNGRLIILDFSCHPHFK